MADDAPPQHLADRREVKEREAAAPPFRGEGKGEEPLAAEAVAERRDLPLGGGETPFQNDPLDGEDLLVDDPPGGPGEVLNRWRDGGSSMEAPSLEGV